MVMKLPLYQVDAFTSEIFKGNAAAVCVLEKWLSDSTMQAIAAENNVSETAFIVPKGEHYAIRWFTPVMEVDLCGHATLASGHVVHRHLRPGQRQINFDSRSGPLGVSIDGEWLTLDFPAADLTRVQPTVELIEALGAVPTDFYDSDYWLAVLENEAEVAAVEPDFRALKDMVPVGIIVTAKGDEVDFVSRFFAPAAGIDEDPATGSAHCILTPYWAEQLGRSKLRARQISARGAELVCELAGERVWISGQVAPYLVGTIELRD